jgi:hypothetical protein
MKTNIRTTLIALATLAVANTSFGAVIFTNEITGTNPNTANPYTTGQTFDANITVTGIGRGAGITGANANDRYNANSWNTVALDPTAYFTFTLTPNALYEIDYTSFVYTGQASGTGATSFAFRSNAGGDNFTTNLGTPTATGATINLSGPAFQNVTTAIEFRLYGWGASASGGTFSVNSFTFNGDVVAIPEPSRALLLGIGGLGLIFRRRRQ